MPDTPKPSQGIANEIEVITKQFSIKEERDRSLRLKYSISTAIFSIGGLAVSISALLGLTKDSPATKQEAEFLNQIANFRIQLDEQKRRVQELTATQKPNLSGNASQEKLASDLALMDKRLVAIESSILDNPERALSIPLLRKDISDIVKHSEEQRLAIKTDIDRIYEQQKWMLGGIGTVLLAIAGGAISIILKSLPKSKSSAEN